MPPFATDEIAWTRLSHAKTARGARTVARRLATICTQTLALGGCTTPKERQAAENAARNEQVAQEIEGICALHGAEREAALKELKAASGMDLYCPLD
jgi:hypothetical protein